MKMTLAMLLVLSTLLCTAARAGAADSPVAVSHSLAGYSAGTPLSQVEFALQVSNPGETALSGLTLALVPRPPFQAGPVLEVGTLAPHQTATVSLRLEVRSTVSQPLVAQRQLRFVGKYLDASGTPQQFPVTSFPDGGAK